MLKANNGTGFTLYEGDCIEQMKSIDDGSIDLIAVDPPYFRMVKNAWDNAWDNRGEFLAWLGTVADEWKRVLKPNGSLYVFASPQMAWHVEGVIRDRFNVLSNIRWQKPPFATKAEMFNKDDLRSPFPASETIIFAEQHPVWMNLITDARKALGYSKQDVSELIVNSRSGACWNWEAGIRFPEREHWNNLRKIFITLPDYNEIERPFNATPDAPYTDVWTFPTVQARAGKHPCEKPLDLLKHIVRLSSKPGATVLDCFLGSGTTGHACVNLDRNFIGIDSSAHWVRYSERRLRDAQRLKQRQPKQLTGHESDYSDSPLFATRSST